MKNSNYPYRVIRFSGPHTLSLIDKALYRGVKQINRSYDAEIPTAGHDSIQTRAWSCITKQMNDKIFLCELLATSLKYTEWVNMM